jgi:hypothetical protein
MERSRDGSGGGGDDDDNEDDDWDEDEESDDKDEDDDADSESDRLMRRCAAFLAIAASKRAASAIASGVVCGGGGTGNGGRDDGVDMEVDSRRADNFGRRRRVTLATVATAATRPLPQRPPQRSMFAIYHKYMQEETCQVRAG